MFSYNFFSCFFLSAIFLFVYLFILHFPCRSFSIFLLFVYHFPFPAIFIPSMWSVIFLYRRFLPLHFCLSFSFPAFSNCRFLSIIFHSCIIFLASSAFPVSCYMY